MSESGHLSYLIGMSYDTDGGLSVVEGRQISNEYLQKIIRVTAILIVQHPGAEFSHQIMTR
jgi:hypothetical protein